MKTAATTLSRSLAELSPLERFISACTSGNPERAASMLANHPNLRGELRSEHHLMMHVPAERGDSKVLETMLECGFDPRNGRGFSRFGHGQSNVVIYDNKCQRDGLSRSGIGAREGRRCKPRLRFWSGICGELRADG